MLTKKIEDRTVKEILEVLLGPENTEKVLMKFQQEFDKGTRGKEWKDFARNTLDELPSIEAEKRSISVGIAVTFGEVLTISEFPQR